MPLVIAGAAVSGAFAAASVTLPWLAAGAFIKAFATSMVLGGLSHALSPKPKKPAATVQEVNAQTFAVRQTDSPQKHVYGVTRLADVFAHIVATGNNEKLHAFIVLCADEVESIDEVWVDDYVIPSDWLAADGTVNQGRYANKLRIRKHLGSPSQVADTLAVAEIPDWTSDHRGQGIAYIYVTLTKDRDVYPSGMPNFSAVVKGRKIHDVRTGTAKFTTNLALIWQDFIETADFGYQARTDQVDQTNVAAQANISDEIVDTPVIDSIVSSIAASADIITLEGNRLSFELGDRVEIIAPGSPPGGLATSTDYYVIPYQRKDAARIKLATSLDNALASIAIDITSAGSGTITVRKTGEPRYHGSGIINTSDALGDSLNAILASMAGRCVNTAGYWKLLVGAWREPELELTIGDMRSGMNWRRPIAMAEKFNVIIGKYIGSINNYQPIDYPKIRYQAFIDQDGGIEYPPKDLGFAFTDRATTAQRIAKIELFRARQEIVFTTSFSMKAFQVETGDTVYVTVDALGWDLKAFEITQLVIMTGSAQNPALVMALTLRETAEEIYSADPEEFLNIDPAPNTNLPDVFTVEAITGMAFSSRSVETQDGDFVFSLVLSWDLHPNGFVINDGFIEIQFKLSSSSNWMPSFFVSGDLIESPVLTSSVNVSYDLRARAINSLGRRSAWNTIVGAVVGTSGGVGATLDYGNWTEGLGASLDYEDFSGAPGTSLDYEFFT